MRGKAKSEGGRWKSEKDRSNDKSKSEELAGEDLHEVETDRG
jgi:hypothetical protein